MNNPRFSICLLLDDIDKQLNDHRCQKNRSSALRWIIRRQRCLGVLCLKCKIFYAMSYFSRKKYGGMEMSDAKRLTTMREENTKLKKLLAEAMVRIGFQVTR